MWSRSWVWRGARREDVDQLAQPTLAERLGHEGVGARLDRALLTVRVRVRGDDDVGGRVARVRADRATDIEAAATGRVYVQDGDIDGCCAEDAERLVARVGLDTLVADQDTTEQQ